MTAILVVVTVATLAVAYWLARQLRIVKLELSEARRVASIGEDSSLTAAIEEERREAEDRVAHAEAVQHWLRAALDESTDAIVIVDRIGREVVRNAIAHRFAGARTGEALAEEALADILHTALEGHSSERELQLYNPPRLVLQLRAFPLRRAGEVVGAVGFMRDISEARRVESVRRDFVANVSHELKTPIGALALLAETMAETSDANTVRQLAERVVREAYRLSTIVDDLLDLSTIEGEGAATREPVPVGRLIEDAVDLVAAPAAAAGVPLRVTPMPSDLEVICDERQLRSALVNLLDNAIKYSDRDAPVEVATHLDGSRVAIEVRDHGVGIPTRDLERIFERFYRVDRARSRETGGTGLGLSIVRHVARAHGGDVTVQSREGEGSTFTLWLPLAAGNVRSLFEAS